ncbi:methyltransferase domain-containing protein [Colletotrichum graminicola]|uniref:Ribosomal RNA-processing protein 8 n=1 Tax=Colletotrichum graminicola (strain M1.001 / M2 / FGSC 10212) TaxID=645133 RepID=E3Q9U3_COLGM|nr:methyltransferase domain-containing protein [Colletotrichum graminicola M1.001]EFQ27631.1 methyltransferase domain-containing protein [Colletotrichum graminicola M1.001]WDK11715.1 methyltransferase domain-containing protein [Colletotrichum graminicola]
MFAVPGWSVSADALKPETQTGKKKNNTSKNNSAKKRKKAKKEEKPPGTGANKVIVNQRVFGQAKDDEPKKGSGKRAAPVDDDVDGNDGGGGEEAATPKPSKKQKKDKKSEGEAQETPRSDKKDKKQRKEKPTTPSKEASAEDEKKAAKEAAAAIAASVPPVPPPAAKLTPLQRSMRQKLISARFRHLNETLYTRPSAQAYQLFEESPEMFSEYHEGFRRQVEVWPENPVDGYIRDIKLRARARYPNARGRPGAQPASAGPAPLPRTDGVCYVADLGCGDARLASTLMPEAEKLKLKVLSYDLHSPAEHVIKADIANLPLADDSVDIAIFCLALMGTNWLDFVEEAYRILHWKGELWVAEIKSRFGPVRQKNAVVSHSVGNRKKAAAAANKGKAGEPEETEADRVALAVEVDGHEDKRGETDVSAFVEALRKRGFVLAGEGEGNKGAVDMSNKMFVKMRFIKGAAPTKGKGLAAAKAAGFVDKEKKKKQKRFVWETEEEKVDESAILKPCLYKIR